ncbi:outer membrane protein assembly factor BamA [uncultured Alistipes sp.]|uniref:outer membrane protein assembly factor BamA n=1 Tax=uncultured Alistipes sp. TaxID=538949 RepID=UPI0026163EC6|nr:outer membrane protein assembly factor BamA [uncultured Alistipes sp.]
MKRSGTVFLSMTAAFMLACPQIFAQEIPAPTVPEPTGTEISEEQLVEQFEKAPMLDQTTPKFYYIRRVNIHGAPNLNHSIIQASSELVPGDSIYLPSNFISAAISRLWNQRLYSDVRIGATIDGDNVDLEVFLQERPRVNYWRFEGISKTNQKDLLEKLKLKRGSELSDYIIDKNSILIRKYFSDKGFRNAEVSVRIENDSVLRQAVNVTFIVDRKKKVKIGKITFTGNHEFSDKRLRRTFKKTHQKNINFFQGAKFKEEDFEEDKDLLIDFYNSKGFRNASILSDSIYPINDKRMGIQINLSEGNKYYIRNVSWVGNSIYQTDQLEQMFGVEKGSVYDKKSMYKRLGVMPYSNPDEPSIMNLYKDQGYLMAQVDPAEIIIGPDSIDMELRIFEGKQFTINNVGISGNLRIDDEAIRRELYTRPGELYNQSLLFQTIRTLASMGHFSPELIAPEVMPVTNSDNLVDINWPLEETASDQFQIAGGWGGGTFVGSVGITLNNLSIRNFFKKGAWRPYPMGQNQRLSISAQTNGTYYKAFALSFTDPWMGGRKPNSFTIGAHYSEETNAYYAWQRGTRYFRTLGVSVGLGKRLNWPDPYFTFYAEASYERYMLNNWESFIITNGSSNLFSIRLMFGRNSVDQPIYPRRGSEFSISVQLTPPYSLWDGKDYKSSSLSDNDRYKWIEFHKWILKGQWFTSLTSNGNLVLMARAEMGYLGHYNKHKVSPFERFEVGGDGMTGYNIYGIDIISMRGYDDGALDPVGSSYSIAYNKYTMELRYPLLLKGQTNIYALGFIEGGNGFSSWDTFSPFRIKRSAGVGIRLFLPVVGMLGVDWGYGFDPAAGETKRSGGHIHFTMGMQF